MLEDLNVSNPSEAMLVACAPHLLGSWLDVTSSHIRVSANKHSILPVYFQQHCQFMRKDYFKDMWTLKSLSQIVRGFVIHNEGVHRVSCFA
jgi:hypothetical protein